MNKKIIKLAISSVLFIIGFFSSYPVPFYLLSYFLSGYDVLWKAIKNIFHGKIFDENFLMSLATVGAISMKIFPEAAAVMLFYQFGEIFQDYAVDKSRKSITSLMDLRPDSAKLWNNGNPKIVNPRSIKIGDIIQIDPGERIPLDGIVIKGKSRLDTSALTGESVPRTVGVNDTALSGSINQNGVLLLKVTTEFSQSTVSKILELVEEAGKKKAKTENFITRFASFYTPIVVASALLLAFLPPLLISGADFSTWLYRALTFLVVSCPCALVISVPLSFFGGIGGASKQGILVKGSSYLELLSHVDTVIFDKTGTLTKGTFTVQKIMAENGNSEKLLEIAALSESHSSHPIASSLKAYYGKKINESRVSEIEELSGLGIKSKVDGVNTYTGNSRLMKKYVSSFTPTSVAGTVVYVAQNNSYLGYILISDEIREDSKLAVEKLKKMGIKKTVMLTGDNDIIGQDVGKKIGIDSIFTELLPQDKVKKEQEILSKMDKNSKLAFVGDGINDAPVLAMADIGIAMGGVGSDAAIEAADIVIMTDEPAKIAKAIAISKKTLTIVTENITFALAVKFGVLILSAFGLATMWEAVFADVGVSLLAVLNSMRALNVKKL